VGPVFAGRGRVPSGPRTSVPFDDQASRGCRWPVPRPSESWRKENGMLPPNQGGTGSPAVFVAISVSRVVDPGRPSGGQREVGARDGIHSARPTVADTSVGGRQSASVVIAALVMRPHQPSATSGRACANGLARPQRLSVPAACPFADAQVTPRFIGSRAPSEEYLEGLGQALAVPKPSQDGSMSRPGPAWPGKKREKERARVRSASAPHVASRHVARAPEAPWDSAAPPRIEDLGFQVAAGDG